MSLAELAAFAVTTQSSSRSTTPMYELAIKEARKLVKIKDGNRKPSEDGSQALTVTLGRYTFGLDIIAAGASRITAAKDQVEQFTGILQAAIDEGSFDKEIEDAQLKSVPKIKASVIIAEDDTPEETVVTEDVATDAPDTTTLSLNKATPVVDSIDSEVDIDGLDFAGIE